MGEFRLNPVSAETQPRWMSISEDRARKKDALRDMEGALVQIQTLLGTVAANDGWKASKDGAESAKTWLSLCSVLCASLDLYTRMEGPEAGRGSFGQYRVSQYQKKIEDMLGVAQEALPGLDL